MKYIENYMGHVDSINISQNIYNAALKYCISKLVSKLHILQTIAR